jgi:hypothetical protein
VARRCVWSRNLENEEAKARYWAVKIQPKWVVTPGKQTNKQGTEFKIIQDAIPLCSSGHRRLQVHELAGVFQCDLTGMGE